jgi:hypothetical protein
LIQPKHRRIAWADRRDVGHAIVQIHAATVAAGRVAEEGSAGAADENVGIAAVQPATGEGDGVVRDRDALIEVELRGLRTSFPAALGHAR